MENRTGFAEVNGTKIYYEVKGEGHPLVFVHGHLVDRRMWDDQWDVFAQNYKVIRYDAREKRGRCVQKCKFLAEKGDRQEKTENLVSPLFSLDYLLFL